MVQSIWVDRDGRNISLECSEEVADMASRCLRELDCSFQTYPCDNRSFNEDDKDLTFTIVLSKSTTLAQAQNFYRELVKFLKSLPDIEFNYRIHEYAAFWQRDAVQERNFLLH